MNNINSIGILIPCFQEVNTVREAYTGRQQCLHIGGNGHFLGKYSWGELYTELLPDYM